MYVEPTLSHLRRSKRGQDALKDIGVKPNWAVDSHTYRQNFLLWEKLQRSWEFSEKPLPPARVMVPAVVDGWNNFKGGVDVISRLLANVRTCHPRIRLHGRLNPRFFQTLLMNAHLTLRMDEVSRETPPNLSWGVHFKTYKQHKARINSKRSYEGFLLLVHRNWNKLRVIPESADDDGQNGAGLFMSKRARKNAYQVRHWFNTGEMKKVRERKRGPGHEHVPTRNAGVKEGRCIVCCELCKRDLHDDEKKSKRQGHKTRNCCMQCAAAVAARKGQGAPAKGIPLCRVKSVA